MDTSSIVKKKKQTKEPPLNVFKPRLSTLKILLKKKKKDIKMVKKHSENHATLIVTNEGNVNETHQCMSFQTC